jgi:putative oxygen-independent coproporphyrinogen III oxidase
MVRLPDGDAAPADGTLPAAALRTLAQRPLGIYVHVPFCTARCGYCDFNVYVEPGLRAGFAEAVEAELALAARTLGAGGVDIPPASTVFIGGGTPTVLPAEQLRAILASVQRHIGAADDAEVTIEGNPESIDAPLLEQLREAGVSCLSLGMQSASPRVLAALDRLHTPGRAREAALAARAAGFEVVGLDLIFGADAESDEDWEATLAEAVSLQPDRVSAYELTVEPGTRLAAQVRSGLRPAPDQDVVARRYVRGDEALSEAGLSWYEISSWARDDAARSRHNIGYWTGANWWGVGPGAHSHVGGVRWWNVLHPRPWATRLSRGQSPAAAREQPDAAARLLERLMLELRLAEGAPLSLLTPDGRTAVDAAASDGLLEIHGDRMILTMRGRLIADAVVRDLSV